MTSSGSQSHHTRTVDESICLIMSAGSDDEDNADEDDDDEDNDDIMDDEDGSDDIDAEDDDLELDEEADLEGTAWLRYLLAIHVLCSQEYKSVDCAA